MVAKKATLTVDDPNRHLAIKRLAAQFTIQAKRAIKLAELLEQAEAIEVIA